MIPFGLASLMTVSLPIARRATKCLVPGASAIYLCNEGSGMVLRDYSGNGNDGTLAAAPDTPTWGAAGLIHAGPHYVTLPDLTFAGAYTVVYVATRTDVAGSDMVIGHTSTNQKLGWKNDGNPCFIKVVPSGLSDVSVTPAGNGVTPCSYAVVRGADDKADLSINGGAFSRLYSDTAQAGAVTWNRLRGVADTLTGTISFVAFYPFALTAAQVAQMHAAIKALLAPRGVALP